MYPGLPGPRIEPYLSHAASRPLYGGAAEFSITRVFLLGSTATYLDSPWHRHPGLPDLAGLDLATVADLEGRCLDPELSGGREARLGADTEALTGCAVLIRTGWSHRWGTDAYWRPGPYLGAAAIDRLVNARPALVGVDFWNADDPTDPARPAHTRLLGAGIPVIEHLRGLDQLPASGFRFSAVPLAIIGGASFPVRAFAVLEG